MNGSSDEENDGNDFFSFQSFNFEKKPRSEEELLKVGIRENGKIIKLKEDMYIEDKNRSWTPYRNKYSGDITDEKLVAQNDETNVLPSACSVSLDVLTFVICWGIFEWIIFSCNISSPYNHTIRVLVATVALFKLFTNCSATNESCTNHKVMDGCRDPKFVHSDPDEHFVFRCLSMSLWIGKISRFEVILNWDFIKPIVAYIVFLITFYIMTDPQFGTAVQIIVGCFVCSFLLAKVALFVTFNFSSSNSSRSSSASHTSGVKRSTNKYEKFSAIEFYKSTVPVVCTWALVELLSCLNAAPKQVAVIGRVISIFFIAAKMLGHAYLKYTERFDCSLNRRKICEG